RCGRVLERAQRRSPGAAVDREPHAVEQWGGHEARDPAVIRGGRVRRGEAHAHGEAEVLDAADEIDGPIDRIDVPDELLARTILGRSSLACSRLTTSASRT